MNEELKRKLKKIYDYENKIDFEPFGKDYVPYRPSIREIDKECIEYIKTKIDNVELKRLVLSLKKEEIKNSIKEHKYGIEKEVNKLEILRKENLENDEFIAEEKITKVFNQEDYLYANILELLLKEIYKEEEPYYEINEKNNRLKETYKFIDEDEQYKKYGLLKLNNNRNLEKPMLNSPPYYIHDNRKGYIVLDSRIPYEVLNRLYCLKHDNLITDLSLRANYYMKIQKSNPHVAFEERAFGKYFSFENLKNLIPTKLYSTVTNNSLWINIKNGSITFEELLDDFEVGNKEEFVRTQVIHCEYFEDKEEFYISHIDHE